MLIFIFTFTNVNINVRLLLSACAKQPPGFSVTGTSNPLGYSKQLMG